MKQIWLLGLCLLPFIGESNSKAYLVKTKGKGNSNNSNSNNNNKKLNQGNLGKAPRRAQLDSNTTARNLTTGNGNGNRNGNDGTDGEHLKTYMCMRDLSDRLPTHLNKVLENPKRYVAGPDSEAFLAKEAVVIVGAGMAGLTAAYLLLSVGHKVTILEGQDRIGGRVHTYYGKGWYGDLGAMRYPQCHSIVMKALNLFDVPVAPFTNYNEGSQGDYYYINGEKFSEEEMFSQTGLAKLYEIHGIAEGQVPRDANGAIENPKKIVEKYIESELYDREHCKQDESLATFLRRKLAADDYDARIADIYATIDLARPFMTISVDEFLNDADSNSIEGDCHDHTYVEIVNGSSVLPENIMKKLDTFPDFEMVTSAKVTKVVDNDNRVVIYYTKGDNEKKVSGDWALITTTAGAVDLMEFDPPLPYWKELALRDLKYMNAVKVFMKFKTPFWSKPSDANPRPIKYGPYWPNNPQWEEMDTYEKEKMGATGITDKHLKQVYYPSFDYHGPALIASYTWDSDADFYVSLKDEDVQELVLKELEEIHGKVVREEFESMYIKRWAADEFSHGAFVMHEPYQKYTYMDHLRKPYGNIHFAGEYANKQYNGWVEAAMESSIRVVVNRAPEKYEEEFYQAELDFLQREDREYKK